jgi:FdhD protein
MANVDDDFGPTANFEVIHFKDGRADRVRKPVVTEVPLTIMGNEVEIATLLCSPSDLREFVYGFLFTSGFIRSAAEVLSCVFDATKWVAYAELRETPDPSIAQKRLYTSGCGKGVTYAHVSELSVRRPLETDLTVTADQVNEIAGWLQGTSPTYRKTRGLHTAGLSVAGDVPGSSIDDIGRHNAVDKVVGRGLMDDVSFPRTVLVTSGRVSSEILHKARMAGIPIIVARGAPTHQTVLRAREMGIAVVGFARGGSFTVYSREDRVVF